MTHRKPLSLFQLQDDKANVAAGVYSVILFIQPQNLCDVIWRVHYCGEQLFERHSPRVSLERAGIGTLG